MSASLEDILSNWDRLSCRLASQRRNVLFAKLEIYEDALNQLVEERQRIVTDFTDLINNLKTSIRANDNQFNAVELLFEKTPFLSTQKRLHDVEVLVNAIHSRLSKEQDEEDNKDLYYRIQDLSMVPGQESIKSVVSDFILAFAKGGASYALREYMNFLLLGPPGIGKTRFATLIAKILGSLGILVDGTVTIVSRTDFVGQYVGDTAIKTHNLLSSNLEKCLIVDEAYLLGQEEKNSFGHEAIGAMVNFLDKHRGQSVIMALGYETDMERYFLGVNPGMTRRFPLRISLQSYNVAQLRNILSIMLKESGIQDEVPTSETFDALMEKGYFKDQAGDMENLAAFITRRIYSGGGRVLTEGLLLGVVLQYLLTKDRNIFVKEPQLEDTLKLYWEEDRVFDEQARRKYQTEGPQCPARLGTDDSGVARRSERLRYNNNKRPLSNSGSPSKRARGAFI